LSEKKKKRRGGEKGGGEKSRPKKMGLAPQTGMLKNPKKKKKKKKKREFGENCREKKGNSIRGTPPGKGPFITRALKVLLLGGKRKKGRSREGGGGNGSAVLSWTQFVRPIWEDLQNIRTVWKGVSKGEGVKKKKCIPSGKGKKRRSPNEVKGGEKRDVGLCRVFDFWRGGGDFGGGRENISLPKKNARLEAQHLQRVGKNRKEKGHLHKSSTELKGLLKGKGEMGCAEGLANRRIFSWKTNSKGLSMGFFRGRGFFGGEKKLHQRVFCITQDKVPV